MLHQQGALPKILFILFFCILSFAGRTQVLAPDFVCVQNDTLFWNLSVNTCGPFEGVNVYFSTSPTGPFNLLGTVTNPLQEFFYHPNPVNDQFYYYLESDHDCPGVPVLSSDTLDNRSPEVAPLESVSVEGNDVRVKWTASPSPEVFAYIIYRTTPLGTVPIDTVFGNINTYLDIGANPNNQSEAYFVIPIDRCGKSSIFDLPHFTVLVDHFIDPCDQSITLNWNKYQNWPNGIGTQKVWLSFDGGPEELVATLDSSVASYVFENALEGHLYSFYIESSQAGSDFVANSNTIVVSPQLIQTVRNLDLKNVTVTPNNEIELDWTWNTDAEISALAFLSAPQNNGYVVTNNVGPSNPLQAVNFYTETTIDPSSGKQFFRLETTDLCATTFSSNYASTLFLSGTPQENLNNLLQWTAYDVEGGSVQNYELYRIVEGQETLIEVLDGSVTNYSDPVNPEEDAESNVCYYIVANVTYELPDGTIQQLQSRSNQICVQQLSKIFVPNAFMPSGVNTRFKPLIVFNENVSYRMVILNRWGGTVFETTDIDEGWTGRKGLQQLPGGAYSYVIQVTQADGVVIKKTGVFVLIR